MMRALTGLVAALVLFVVVSLWLGVVPASDAYVTFDYARHVSGGDGFVVTAGDAPSEGYTGMLWTLFCAALYRAGIEVPGVAHYLSLLFGALALVVLWFVLRRRSESMSDWLLPLLVAASAGPLVTASMSGTDTMLFAALLAASVLALERALARPGAVNVLLWVLSVALVVVCRFEGIAAAVVAIIVVVRTSRDRRLLAGVVAVAALTVLFHGWRVVAFGDLVPDIVRIHAGFNGALLGRTQPYDIEPFGVYYLLLATVSVAAWKSGPRAPAQRFALVTAGVLALFYLFMEDDTPAQFRGAVVVVLAAVTWPPLVARTRALFAAGTVRRTLTALMVSALLALALGLIADLRISTVRAVKSLEVSKEPLGEWIRTWMPRATVATDQPGAFTYYAGVPVIDLRPGSRIGNPYVGYREMLAAASPEMVVIDAEGVFDSVAMPAIRPLVPLLEGRYRILGALRTDWAKDRTFLIYLRADVPLISDEARSAFPPGIGAILRLNR